MSRKRQHQRLEGNRPYRKLFVIATEGKITEKCYFMLLNNQTSTIKLKCLHNNHKSSPPQVLKKMTDYLKKSALRKSDEAWLVVDNDSWTQEQLMQLHAWSKKSENFNFALSNPKFEYWLLLHFEDGNGLTSSDDCSNRLEKYLPNYTKNHRSINTRTFNTTSIETAIARAKKRDTPPCVDWPQTIGGTTLYKLIEKLL